MNWTTVAGTAVSLVAVSYLAACDPKRRRAFRLPPRTGGRPGLAWTAVLLPGLLVPALDGAAGFFVWLGAVAVLGWVIAAVPPGRTEQLFRLAHAGARACRRRADAALREATKRWRQLGQRRAREAELRARIDELEAEVAAMRRRLAGDVVIELPRGGDPAFASRSRSA